MRITTNMTYQSSMKALQKASERLDSASEQMSSGNKFNTAGEDPTGMAQKLSLTSKINAYQQFNTNGGSLDSSLSIEGTALDSFVSSIQSAQTLVQRANNATLSAEDKKSIATELTEIQKQLFNLMNTQNADGEYIFSGNQSDISPFYVDSSGVYKYQGDDGQRSVQVAPAIQIASNDPGSSVFQSVATRRTASPASSNLSITVDNQNNFDAFFKANYDFSSTADNSFTLTTTAGSPSPDLYTISDSSGDLLSGTFTLGEPISFNGLSLTVYTAGSESFEFDVPENDNILNTLSDMINALNNSESLSASDWSNAVADTQVHLSNTLDKVNMTLGAIGGRQNNLEQVMSSNSALETISTEAKANVSEVDLYEAISNVSQEQNALTMAQNAFAQTTRSTLFDYI